MEQQRPDGQEGSEDEQAENEDRSWLVLKETVQAMVIRQFHHPGTDALPIGGICKHATQTGRTRRQSQE